MLWDEWRYNYTKGGTYPSLLGFAMIVILSATTGGYLFSYSRITSTTPIFVVHLDYLISNLTTLFPVINYRPSVNQH